MWLKSLVAHCIVQHAEKVVFELLVGALMQILPMGHIAELSENSVMLGMKLADFYQGSVGPHIHGSWRMHENNRKLAVHAWERVKSGLAVW